MNIKHFKIIAPAILSLLTLTIAPKTHAETVVTPRNNGDVEVSPGKGGCTVLFDSRGDIITKGRSCSDRDLNKARQAIDSYRREQNADDPNDHRGDYADSDAGGPDFWEATNFKADFLGLRRKPDQDAVIDFRVKKGSILRNLGCKKHDDVRWCQVQVKNKPEQKGWVKGEYLRESSGSR
jgi:hypothetical protein